MGKSLAPGFYPFWFWNDHLEIEEIHYQIQEMASKGVKGFFIHPRQGLQQPYLSKAFFDMVDVAIDAAGESDLVINLYDEYPYPSGVAGGEVILGTPRFYATELVQKSMTVDGGKVRVALPPGKVLSALAYPLNEDGVLWEKEIDLRDSIGIVLTQDVYLEVGLTVHSRKRYFSAEPVPVLQVLLPDYPHRIFVNLQVEVKRFKYWGNYVDVLNKDAIHKFIECTHERYKSRYVQKFGEAIYAVFVDEARPRWSEIIPQAFLEEYGYDLCEKLPALQDPTYPEHLKVSYDLYRLKYNLFIESFEEPILGWCKENKLAYCGEKDSLRLSQLKYMDIPGCEPGHIKAGEAMDLLGPQIRGNAKATASAAYFYDKEGALCECYHSIGWSGTLQDAKLIADGLVLLGIKYLVPHGFFYSTHGLKKHDAPPSFFFQMPYWPLFGGLCERIDSIWRHFSNTYVAAEVLLVDPHSGIPTDEDMKTYVEIQALLIENHIGFHIVDTDVLEMGKVEGNCIQVKDIRTTVVIMPPMQVIEKPLQEWLRDFQKAGGKVVSCILNFSRDELLSEIGEVVMPDLSVRWNGTELSAVWVVKRISKDDGRTVWFLLNTGTGKYEVEIRTDEQIGEVRLDKDIISDFRKVKDYYLRTIYPFESFMLETVSRDEWQQVQQLPFRLEVPVTDAVRLRLCNKNLLRMYDWKMSILDANDLPIESANVVAVPLIEQLDKSRFRFVPHYRKYFGYTPELDFPEMRIRYEFTFAKWYLGTVDLVMEPGSIGGDWKICINDCITIQEKDFGFTQAHIRGSMGKNITAYLDEGDNMICVEVIGRKPTHGLRNPLYLAGDFGVCLDPPALVDQKDEGRFGDYRENLMPYYAGVIEYTTDFWLNELPETEFVVVEFGFSQRSNDAMEVSVNGGEFQALLWEPRCVLLSVSGLRKGINELRVRVYTSLIRSFEGVWFDDSTHTYSSV